MGFEYVSTVRFQDTDAAGIVYFACVMSFCHAAYEESLVASGVDLRMFFSGQTVAVPIVQATVDFLKPMYCGDRFRITLTPILTTETSFAIDYEIGAQQERTVVFARAKTQHVSIDSGTRRRTFLSIEMMNWLKQWGVSVATD